MIHVEFRFYGPLNDFLPAEARQKPVTRVYAVKTTFKDAVEGIGIPHTEIQLYVRNKEQVPGETYVEDGDRIAVYPWFITADHADARFVLDGHLGRLAAYLRMLGFDCVYRNQIDDDELARIATAEDRILVTRDIGLLKRNTIRRGRWLRHTDPREQSREIVERFGLAASFDPFTRCMHCNQMLRAVDKADAAGRVPPGVAGRFEDFRECPACKRVYWPGSHYQRMKTLIQWLGEADPQSPTGPPPAPSVAHSLPRLSRPVGQRLPPEEPEPPRRAR